MDFSNLAQAFRTTPAPAPAAPATPAAGAPAGGGGTGMEVVNPGAGAGASGAKLGPDGKPVADSSPLDGFTDLFKIDDKNKPAPDPFADPLFKVDPAKLAEHVNKLDFARSVNPEVMQKALSGGPEAPAAMAEVMNTVTRASFMAATQMLTAVTENAFKTNNKRYDSVLSGKFRDFQIRSTPTENAALKHPAAAPVLAAMREQIARTNPDKQPHEVAKMAEEYFIGMSKAITSLDDTQTRDTKGGAGAAKDIDFSQFLS